VAATVLSDNIISPLGITSESNLLAVLAGKSELRSYPATDRLPEPCFASLIDEASLEEEYSRLGLDSSYTVFEKRVILSVSKALEGTGVDPSSDDVLFVVSSTKGNVDLLDTPDCDLDKVVLGYSAARIAGFFGNKVPPVAVSNACISGLCAQICALREIDAGRYSHVIVSGSDVQSRFIISGFQSFKALSEDACRPFDADRKGLNLGEAAATIVFGTKTAPEADDWVLLRGAVRNDANHISGPSRTGEGSYRALRTVLEGVAPEKLAFSSVHGTSTAYNDEMESIALTRAGLAEVPVSGLKGYFGHTMGAAGILEAILSMKAVDNGVVLGTRGYSRTGTSCPLNLSPEARPTDRRAFVKLLSGFGGCNAAALFAKGDQLDGKGGLK